MELKTPNLWFAAFFWRYLQKDTPGHPGPDFFQPRNLWFANLTKSSKFSLLFFLLSLDTLLCSKDLFAVKAWVFQGHTDLSTFISRRFWSEEKSRNWKRSYPKWCLFWWFHFLENLVCVDLLNFLGDLDLSSCEILLPPPLSENSPSHQLSKKWPLSLTRCVFTACWYFCWNIKEI